MELLQLGKYRIQGVRTTYVEAVDSDRGLVQTAEMVVVVEEIQDSEAKGGPLLQSTCALVSAEHHATLKVGTKYSLAICDESGHRKFPFFSFVVLSWGELWLISLSFPRFFPSSQGDDPIRNCC